MDDKSRTGGLDVFRLIAAFLVVTIHTSPLASFSPEADFLLTRIVARLAVPFFFMVTGQFVLSGYLTGKTRDFTAVGRFLKKILLLYGGCVILYLPVGIYAGHYQEVTPLSLVRTLFFEGTFYHLWYFPALLLGTLLLCGARRFFSLRGLLVLSAGLYLLGLLGDSYWGLTAQVPGVSTVYEWGFSIFGYTRNGLFMAPLFLLLGVWMGRRKTASPVKAAAGFLLSLALMTAEGFILRAFALQRHDSMYLLLPVSAAFLYALLLSWKKSPCRLVRTASTWIYLLHPAVILLIRGGAKLTNTVWLLVDNSLVHFLAVSLLSGLLAFLLAAILAAFTRKPYQKDRAWIEMDRGALEHNVLVLRSLLPDRCALMPAVKANAYGHGAVQMARALNQMGVSAFCVACIAEGIALRKNGVKGKILILGYTHPQQFSLLRRYRLTQAVVDYDYALTLNGYGKPLAVEIAVDSGMHRLGERAEQMESLCRIAQMEHLRVKGAFTHLCTDDTQDPEGQEYTKAQADLFYRAVNELRSRGLPCPKVHLLASYGALNYPQLAGDYARIGIALYGVKSDEEDYDRSQADLKPVLSLKARVSCVRDLQPGEGMGYGLAFRAKDPTRIAALAIGYGDGLPRALSCGVGSVLLNGKRAPIIGRICMDQTVVDITGIPDVKAGDVAVVIGRSADEYRSAYEIAREAGTITNEILSRLGTRLPRLLV